VWNRNKERRPWEHTELGEGAVGGGGTINNNNVEKARDNKTRQSPSKKKRGVNQRRGRGVKTSAREYGTGTENWRDWRFHKKKKKKT